jgi:ribonuclease G
MTREVLVNVTPRETRAAVLENGALHEIYIERADRRGIVGNIYAGKVTRVLPGMQAAFLDIGIERNAFLHAADIANGPEAKPIADLVRQDDTLLVQVLKDPLGTKGARLTRQLSLPSRFLVYTPYADGIGVSSRITDDPERERLRGAVRDLAAVYGMDKGGHIVRTAAEGVALEALAADMLYLSRLWEHIRTRAAGNGVGKLLHEELPLSVRVLRDEFGPGVTRVLVDSKEEYQRLRAFTDAFMPEAGAGISLHDGPRPLFALHGVEDEIARALERKVPLKSGGYIVIDQTESMTTIDVNTGAYVGYSNQEDTSYRTNLEAAVTIAHQLRLRNLGGIIIIDFIDLESEPHREQLMVALRQALAQDRAQTQVVAVSTLGLVEMTRKRTRESLEHVLCDPCPSCDGRGFLKSTATVCHEIYREVLRQSRQFDVGQVVVLAHPEVIERLLDEEAEVLAVMEQQINKPLRLQAETLYARDQFDVVLA